MATRPELVQMCRELKLNYEGKTTEEMTEMVKEEADNRFTKKNKKGKKMKVRIPITGISNTLLKFLMSEYNFVFRDKKGNKYNYDGEMIL